MAEIEPKLKPWKGLLERFQAGEQVIVAEGYLFEFERRGYLKAGAYVPEIVLERPDLVKGLHEEFVHAGSDVVLAFTYYAHREKMRLIGRENELELINKEALRIARQVADETGSLMAGNLCNTNVYLPDNPKIVETCEAMFKEQVEWAVEGGADYIVLETVPQLGEALLGLETIKRYGNGLPAVITMICPLPDKTMDGVPYTEAMKKLEEAGAAAVGLNCNRGPEGMIPILRKIRQACKGPICAVPICYRTSPECPHFHSLKDPKTGKLAFPFDLPAVASSRTDIAEFAAACKEIGVQYVGLCCGNASHYLRVLAEGFGRHPPASRFSPDMSQHFAFGSDEKLTNHGSEFKKINLQQFLHTEN